MKTGFCFSGGGGRGGFQVGALEWIAEHGPSAYAGGFDVGAGTSVGAVNALAGAMHGRNLERMIRFLVDCYGRLEKTTDVWRWRFPPVAAGLWNLSVGDNEPLRRLLLDLVDFDAVMAGPQVVVTSWDLLAGESAVWNLRTAASLDQLVSMILASSSFPVAFPPEEVRGGLYTDGGVAEVTPLRACVDLGADRVLALVCQAPLQKKKREDFGSVVDVALRVMDGMGDEILRNDLQRTGDWNTMVEMGHPRAKGRRQIHVDVIRPAESLGDSLDFSAETIARRRKLGREAAKRYFVG